MAKLVRLKYTLNRPGKLPEERNATVEGEPQPKNYERLERLLTHPWGDGATVSSVRAVDEKGNPLQDPPAFTLPSPAVSAPVIEQ